MSSGNNRLTPKGFKPVQPQPPNVVQLLIEWVPGSGEVAVQGPVGDKILCYGLLGMARDAIASWKPPETRIETPAADEVARLLAVNGD